MDAQTAEGAALPDRARRRHRGRRTARRSWRSGRRTSPTGWPRSRTTCLRDGRGRGRRLRSPCWRTSAPACTAWTPPWTARPGRPSRGPTSWVPVPAPCRPAGSASTGPGSPGSGVVGRESGGTGHDRRPAPATAARPLGTVRGSAPFPGIPAPSRCPRLSGRPRRSQRPGGPGTGRLPTPSGPSLPTRILPSPPSVSVPSVPRSVPGLPTVPSLPGTSGVPAVPGTTLPSLPSLPGTTLVPPDLCLGPIAIGDC